MRYITGLLALGTPCELDTCGIWNLSKKDYLDENNFKHYESDDSPFKNYGIEQNKFVDYHDVAPTNVANHVRAYLDMLYNKEFEKLKGLFLYALNSNKARQDIFMCVYGKLRHKAEYDEINQFMGNEFGSAWYSYIEAVNKTAEHLSISLEQSLDKLDEKAKENFNMSKFVRENGLYSTANISKKDIEEVINVMRS